VLYLNSLFSPVFTVAPLLLRTLRAVPSGPLVIAPRGELAPAALAIKPRKKKAYLVLARSLRLYDGAVWQASSAHEEADIRREFGPGVRVVVAPDLASPVSASTEQENGAAGRLGARPLKRPGELSAAFLGRISPMKNLSGAIAALARARGDVRFHIYGPAEDEAYWGECQAAIAALPSNVVVRYHGALEPHRVPSALREHHVLFLPSLGENFGHAILEAMAAGCPVLISDRTPWRGLEAAGAGWDVPLSDPSALAARLQACIDMDEDTYAGYSAGARRLARERAADPAAVAASVYLFKTAIDGRGPARRAL
jgi:glycosyltransferase involved in cell wall biosynthesis